MLKTIFLDLDDTLLDFHKAEAAALAKALTALDVPHAGGHRPLQRHQRPAVAAAGGGEVHPG